MLEMKKYKIIALLFATFISTQLSAATVPAISNIQVVGLFKGAAILNINNERKMIRVGDNNAGIHLYEANSRQAKVEIDGKCMVLSMAEHLPIQIGLPPASNVQAHLLSSGGTYNVTGSINSRVTDFVVDTGATYMTISSALAKRLGINYKNAQKLMMDTANGKATAHIVTVSSVRIGGIELNNIKTAVMHDLSTNKVLLGMSFLNKVEMTQKNGVMILKKRS